MTKVGANIDVDSQTPPKPKTPSLEYLLNSGKQTPVVKDDASIYPLPIKDMNEYMYQSMLRQVETSTKLQ